MDARALKIMALCVPLLLGGCVKRAPRAHAAGPAQASRPAEPSSPAKCGLSCRLKKQRAAGQRTATRAPSRREQRPAPVATSPDLHREPAPQVRPKANPGVYHVVKKGETLWRICHAYGADVQEVSRKNEIDDPTQISVGQRIFIPGADEERVVVPAPLPDAGDEEETETPAPQFRGTLQNPVPEGSISSRFGNRHGDLHEGLDICAPAGTPVLAADDGKVVYSDNAIRGYGNMIIVKHAGNISTVYAHNSRNLVKAGEMVRRGQKIAEVGATGRATGNHCHFEVRVEEKPMNPENFLR